MAIIVASSFMDERIHWECVWDEARKMRITKTNIGFPRFVLLTQFWHISIISLYNQNKQQIHSIDIGGS